MHDTRVISVSRFGKLAWLTTFLARLINHMSDEWDENTSFHFVSNIRPSTSLSHSAEFASHPPVPLHSCIRLAFREESGARYFVEI